jgi:iron(III) transport system permease protein
MNSSGKSFDIWRFYSFVILGAFALFFLYPMGNMLTQAFSGAEGTFTLEHFHKFFAQKYYFSTLFNSVKSTAAVTLTALAMGIPFAYVHTFYRLKGSRLLYILSILCCMSAPFIGAYSWILLMGRSGAVVVFLKNVLNIRSGSIYGFKGIVLVQSLKLYPLVFIYMTGAFKSIDNSLLEVAESLNCTGIRRFFKVTLMLSMPTVLAAALLVFMRAFADFGTPLLIGEGYRTFPVEIYNQYLGEQGGNHHFAAAISVVAIVITAVIFLSQKFVASKFSFSLSALHPVQRRTPKGLFSLLINAFSWILVGVAFIPQLYVIYISFRNVNNKMFAPGYSLVSYRAALEKQALESMANTLIIGGISLVLIVIVAVIIAYLAVRRKNALNNSIDVISMLPYIIPGSVVGIALVTAFNSRPLVLTGSLSIMVIAVCIRRLPYTIRSSVAALQQIPLTAEEAAISLGATKMGAFFRVTVPMMSHGVVAGAILSWVAIITELSTAIILYNARTVTLTLSTYIAVSRGTYGTAAAFATILTVFTTLSLLLWMKISKTDDIRL